MRARQVVTEGCDDSGTVAIASIGPADSEEFLAAVLASRTLHYPWVDLADTPERFAALLLRFSASDQFGCLVRHVSCGRLVGYVSIGNLVRGALQSANLGYAAFRGHEGRGLMTEGLRRVVDFAFDGLALHRVEANIQPTNERSLALVRRLGFQREGYSPRLLFIDGDWRDHERWALRTDNCPWRTR